VALEPKRQAEAGGYERNIQQAGSERGYGESAADVQRSHPECRRTHEENVGKQPSRKSDRSFELSRKLAITTREQMNQLRRENDTQNRHDEQQEQGETPHRCKHSLCGRVALSLADTRKNGQDRVLDSTLSHQLTQNIGNRKCDEKGIRRSANEHRRNHLISNESE